ncbi:MAG: type II toxin-antitoxin system Phd/YefM family antitoxin [bacterium]
MEKAISKSKFKPRSLEYFRDIEKNDEELIITDHGRPVLKIVPFKPEPEAAMRLLKNSVKKFDKPTEPVGIDEWEALK